jgi:peroxiredoxin
MGSVADCRAAVGSQAVGTLYTEIMGSAKQKETLGVGAKAPDFNLQDMAGKRRTRSELANGKPALLAFYKVSCPTCQFTFPFLERIYRGRTNRDISMYAISQDDAESTKEFDQEFGITIPTLLDPEDEGYPASNAYGLSHVPSLFLVEPDGKITQTITGFDKKAIEELGRRLGMAPFEPGEYVPEWKSG